MSDCEQLKEYYEAYALGALEGEERAALDAHLERRCPVCTAELERARWLVAQLAYLAPEAEPPAALRRKVLAGAGTTKPSEQRGWIPLWAWVGAAALVLFALISIFEMRRYQADLASLQDEIRAAAQMGLVLAGNEVPSPAPNHTFQLWVVPKKGAPLSAGIFNPDAAGTVLLVATPSATLADAAALAVSEEPAGGLPQPTKDRILWVGPVS